MPLSVDDLKDDLIEAMAEASRLRIANAALRAENAALRAEQIERREKENTVLVFSCAAGTRPSLIGLVYVTDEFMQDTAALNDFIEREFGTLKLEGPECLAIQGEN